MSSEPENFEALRRLLAIKRHEQPPPGYFHNFSRQVIVRIQAGEAASDVSLLGRLLQPVWWVRGLWSSFEAKPVVAGAFGVGVCGLLVVGLVSSERMDADPNALTIPPQTSGINLANVPSQNASSSLFERTALDHSSTDTVSRVDGNSSILDEIQRPHVQNVSFSAAH